MRKLTDDERKDILDVLWREEKRIHRKLDWQWWGHEKLFYRLERLRHLYNTINVPSFDINEINKMEKY